MEKGGAAGTLHTVSYTHRDISTRPISQQKTEPVSTSIGQKSDNHTRLHYSNFMNLTHKGQDIHHAALLTLIRQLTIDAD